TCALPISFGLFRDQTKSVNGLTGTNEVNPWLATFFVHEAELHHRTHVQRGEETLEGHLQFFCRMTTEFDPRIKISGGFAVSVRLSLLLLSSRGGRRDIRMNRRGGLLGRCHRLWRGLCWRLFLRRVFLSSGLSRRIFLRRHYFHCLVWDVCSEFSLSGE